MCSVSTIVVHQNASTEQNSVQFQHFLTVDQFYICLGLVLQVIVIKSNVVGVSPTTGNDYWDKPSSRCKSIIY